MNDATQSLPLRELKKQRTALALRVTARGYFKRMSYEEAKLTDIARDAEVSSTTVYNYFATKLELLYAVISEDNLDTNEKAKKLSIREWADAVEPVHAFAPLFFRWFDSYHRSALQALLGAAFVARSEAHTEYAHIDELEIIALTELVVALQQQRLIEPTLDSTFIGNLLFNLMNAEYFTFVSDESRTVDAALASLRRQLEFLAPIWMPQSSRGRRR